MEPEKKDEPQQQVATRDVVAEPKAKNIDVVEDADVKGIFDIPEAELKNIRLIKVSGNSYGPAVCTKLGKIVEGTSNLQVVFLIIADY
jgi:Ran GTPase-activating protein (RanGAP) involved in mRNA processing and transport